MQLPNRLGNCSGSESAPAALREQQNCRTFPCVPRHCARAHVPEPCRSSLECRWRTSSLWVQHKERFYSFAAPSLYRWCTLASCTIAVCCKAALLPSRRLRTVLAGLDDHDSRFVIGNALLPPGRRQLLRLLSNECWTMDETYAKNSTLQTAGNKVNVGLSTTLP